jgi:hypothetical protein
VTAWHEEPLSKNHDLQAFDCHDDLVNQFLILRARRSHDWGGVKTFLAIDDNFRNLMGFYTLGPVSVQTSKRDVPPWGVIQREQVGFRLPYLAVDRTVQRRGLGGQLLVSAGLRCLRASMKVGGNVLLVAATSDKAARWFASYGAAPLLDRPRSLLLPLASIEAVLKSAGRWIR